MRTTTSIPPVGIVWLVAVQIVRSDQREVLLKPIRILSVIVVLMGLWHGTLIAQSDRATLTGTDATGGVVPEAAVIVTNRATNSGLSLQPRRQDGDSCGGYQELWSRQNGYRKHSL